MASLGTMSSIYGRGDRLWARIKNEHGKWVSQRTPYVVGEEDKALRYAAAGQRELVAKQKLVEGGPVTVRAWSTRWLAEREKLGLRSVRDDRGRINNHVIPVLGDMRLEDVRPKHVRDLVRSLRKAGEIAPRTIRNTYGILHTMFRDAQVEEIIPAIRAS
jgi:hypothetical protein